MRNIIILGVMGIVLFGLAAGASMFLTNYLQDHDRNAHGDTAAQGTGHDKELPPPLTRGTDTPSRSRLGPAPENEQLVQEWSKLHEREEAIGKQETQLAARKRMLELIKEDIKGEREGIDKLRKELNEQAEGTKTDLDAAERKVKNMEEAKAEQEHLLKKAQEGVYQVENLRKDNIVRVSGIADTAEPTEVAVILERMIESGNTGMMTAAQILAGMKDRRAAQVLSAMQNKDMAADLLEKMVGLKQAGAPSGAKPLGGKAPPTK